MRKGLKRKTYQNLPSLICVEFCPYLGSNHRHHDLKESAFTTETKLVALVVALVSVVRHSPLDRDVGGSILFMGKTQRISKTANFDKFFVSNPFT